MMKIIASDLVDYFFPHRCLICEHIVSEQNCLCVNCSIQLKFSQCHLNLRKNELIELFHGRLKLDQAYYVFKNDEKGISKKIVHELKYNSNFKLIEVLADTIKLRLDDQMEYDWILPVPLNKRKLKQRGYNQSEWIAKSIFKEDRILGSLVQKSVDTKSQTKFGKLKRWENVEHAFLLNEIELEKIHPASRILVVDDVVTTGATIEAMIASFQKRHPELSFSLFTLLKA